MGNSSRENEIEEMFNIIVDGIIDGEDNNGVPTGNTCSNIAESIYAKGYRKASEVVKEIFDEIDKAHEDCIVILGDMGYLQPHKFEQKIAELKRKYTEGGEGE